MCTCERDNAGISSMTDMTMNCIFVCVCVSLCVSECKGSKSLCLCVPHMAKSGNEHRPSFIYPAPVTACQRTSGYN